VGKGAGREEREQGGRVLSRIPFHPVADLFPLMPEDSEEFKALVEDIRKNGLLTRIELVDGMIIDGRNRYRACLKVVDRVPKDAFIDYSASCGGAIPDLVAYVTSKNLHHRHLTAEQRRELLAKLIAAQPEKSDRAIAKTAKVGKDTVRRVRKEAEATGAVAPVEKRVGADGRARRKPTKKAEARKPFYVRLDEQNPNIKEIEAELVAECRKATAADDPAASAEARKAHYAALEGEGEHEPDVDDVDPPPREMPPDELKALAARFVAELRQLHATVRDITEDGVDEEFAQKVIAQIPSNELKGVAVILDIFSQSDGLRSLLGTMRGAMYHEPRLEPNAADLAAVEAKEGPRPTRGARRQDRWDQEAMLQSLNRLAGSNGAAAGKVA
jgi:hypothetical protein